MHVCGETEREREIETQRGGRGREESEKLLKNVCFKEEIHLMKEKQNKTSLPKHLVRSVQLVEE